MEQSRGDLSSAWRRDLLESLKAARAALAGAFPDYARSEEAGTGLGAVNSGVLMLTPTGDRYTKTGRCLYWKAEAGKWVEATLELQLVSQLPPRLRTQGPSGVLTGRKGRQGRAAPREADAVGGDVGAGAEGAHCLPGLPRCRLSVPLLPENRSPLTKKAVSFCLDIHTAASVLAPGAGPLRVALETLEDQQAWKEELERVCPLNQRAIARLPARSSKGPWAGHPGTGWLGRFGPSPSRARHIWPSHSPTRPSSEPPSLGVN